MRDHTELDSYLNNLQFDDLILLQKERVSTKNLEGGPLISNKLDTIAGQVKKGYSVP